MDNTKELFELMSKIYGELQETKKEMNSKFEQLNCKFDALDNKFDNLENRFDTLENKVDKNSLLLENLDTNIKLVAEVQQSFQEQLGRNLLTDGKTVAQRLDVIELAVTNGSENINDLVDNLDVVKNTVGIHEMDLRMIKHKRNHTF